MSTLFHHCTFSSSVSGTKQYLVMLRSRDVLAVMTRLCVCVIQDEANWCACVAKPCGCRWADDNVYFNKVDLL